MKRRTIEISADTEDSLLKVGCARGPPPRHPVTPYIRGNVQRCCATRVDLGPLSPQTPDTAGTR